MKQLLLVLGITIALVHCRVDYPIGANIAPFGRSSGMSVFVDAIKQAVTVAGYVPPTLEALVAMDNKWIPATDFGIQIFNYQVTLPETVGIWTIVAYDAEANTTVLPWSTSATLVNQTYDPTTRVYISYVQVYASDLNLWVANYPTLNKDIRAIRPGFPMEGYPTFTNSFLQTVKSVNNIRFMDWLQANNWRGAVNWTQRILPSAPTYFVVPDEVIIDLVNTAQINIWINVPVGADDDYVRQMAQLYESTLDHHLIIYLEFGNELWNTAFFSSAIYNFGIANSGDNSYIRWDYTTCGGCVANRRSAARIAQISTIWKEVFGEEAFGVRFRPLWASQAGNSAVNNVGLQTLLHLHGDPAKVVWGCAVAPYRDVPELR